MSFESKAGLCDVRWIVYEISEASGATRPEMIPRVAVLATMNNEVELSKLWRENETNLECPGKGNVLGACIARNSCPVVHPHLRRVPMTVRRHWQSCSMCGLYRRVCSAWVDALSQCGGFLIINGESALTLIERGGMRLRQVPRFTDD